MPLLQLSALALAFAAAQPAPDEDVRVSQLIIYGEDSCPPSTDEEIVVCARRPEDDRFRIPQVLRSNPDDPGNRTWTDRVTELSYVGRTGIGSCSPSGAGGVIGCQEQLLRQAREERAGRDEVNWERLIEQAREERRQRREEELRAAAADPRGGD